MTQARGLITSLIPCSLFGPASKPPVIGLRSGFGRIPVLVN
jgi:hypothetical protein